MLVLPIGFVISILSLILTRHRRKNKAPLAAYSASYGAQNANAGPAYEANPAGPGGQGTPLEVDGWQQQRQDQYNEPPNYAYGTGGGAAEVNSGFPVDHAGHHSNAGSGGNWGPARGHSHP
jgi:hypothetical protein